MVVLGMQQSRGIWYIAVQPQSSTTWFFVVVTVV